MKLSNLLEYLSEYEFTYLARNSSHDQVFSFQPYHNSIHPVEDMLYVADHVDNPPYRGEKNITILFFSSDFVHDSKQAFVKESQNCNIIALQNKYDKTELFDLLTRRFLEESRYTSMINHMFMVSNENRGLQYLVDEACKITKCPIIIIDTSYKVLAMYNDSLLESRPDLEQQREMGYLTDQNIQRLKSDKIYEKMRDTNYPFYNIIGSEKFGWLNTLVYIHGIEVAEIGMMETDHTFNHYDFEFLNFFSRLVSLEMQKDGFYENNRGVMHSIFLSDLLDHNIPNQNIVNMRKKQLGWTDKEFLYVLTIFDEQEENSRNKPQIIANQLKNILPYSRWVVYEDRLIFLIMLDSDELNFIGHDGLLYKTLEINKLKGVISNRFQNLLEIKKYFQQTTIIYHLREQIGEEKTIYIYSDHMFYHIGQILSETHDLNDFYHPAITKIKLHDHNNQTHFLETLQEYLIHIDNPTQCAKNLFIHKNTFFYRMNKIRELFSLDLNNGMERLKLHLTLEFMKIGDAMEHPVSNQP